MSEREVVFKALVGSHNYNLNTPESDKDYKVFTFPTFEDLYYGKEASHSTVGQTADYDYHDVRKINHLFWKANLNFIEVLYSREIVFMGDFPEIQVLFSMRDDIVRMNLPYLFDACRGMFYEKMKKLEKGTEGTQYLVDKFGYDTKQALHAWRILDFAIRFADRGFVKFAEAMTYDSYGRHRMLEIKGGDYTLEEFKNLAAVKFTEFLAYEPRYKAIQPNEETKAKVENLIMSLVKNKLLGV
jgi:predicted nucleotidyltransferase